MPVFISMTAGEPDAYRNNTAKKASIYFAIILIVSFLVGSYILTFFGISISAMRIAGGLIILSSGYALLSGDHAKSRAVDKKVQTEAIDKDDISLTPIAMPLLAGPGSISLLVGYAKQENDTIHYLTIISVIVIVGLSVYAILRLAPLLVDKLGAAGINALSRIMGFIVMCVGIQFIINGTTAVVNSIMSP